MNFWKSSKRPLTPPLIFGKSYCRFFKKLYSLKNHTCGIFLKSPGYESIKNNDPCCQIQSLNFKFWGWLGPRLLVHWAKVRGSHRSGTGSHMETHRTEHVYIYRQFVVRGTSNRVQFYEMPGHRHRINRVIYVQVNTLFTETFPTKGQFRIAKFSQMVQVDCC